MMNEPKIIKPIDQLMALTDKVIPFETFCSASCLDDVCIENTFFVDNSLIEWITTCGWGAYLKSGTKLQNTKGASPLVFGGAIHAALAYRYKREATDRPWSAAVQKAILKHYFATHPKEEDWRTLDLAVNTLAAYNEEYTFTKFDICKTNIYNFPAVERSFAIYVGYLYIGERIIHLVYIGKIDLLVNYKANAQIFVRDFKTTSMLGDSYWQDKEISEQQRGYCWAIKETMGFEPDGYEICTIALRKPSKTGTSIEFKEQRFYTKIPEGQLELWKRNMIRQVYNYLIMLHSGTIQRNHVQCVRKYGTCEYFESCKQSTVAKQMEVLQGSEFEPVKWSPLVKHTK